MDRQPPKLSASHPSSYDRDQIKEFTDFEECSTDDWYTHQSGGGAPGTPNEMKFHLDHQNEMDLMRPSSSGGFQEDLEDYSNEPPLLEELGVRFDHIFIKTQAVILPTKVQSLRHSIDVH
jgi:hypothetical protein